MKDEFYEDVVRETRVYPREDPTVAITYTALGLAGEAGEVANQIKKIIRDDNLFTTPERRDKIIDELGDVLWYVTALSDELDISLHELKTRNADKLLNRKANDAIHGDRRESQSNEPRVARGLLQILPEGGIPQYRPQS